MRPTLPSYPSHQREPTFEMIALLYVPYPDLSKLPQCPVQAEGKRQKKKKKKKKREREREKRTRTNSIGKENGCELY